MGTVGLCSFFLNTLKTEKCRENLIADSSAVLFKRQLESPNNNNHFNSGFYFDHTKNGLQKQTFGSLPPFFFFFQDPMPGSMG